MNKIYTGPETKKASQTFQLSGQLVSLELIYQVALVKKAAALTNLSLGKLSQQKADLIVRVCEEIISGQHDQQFITQTIQGGAGTSINMNVNEVIAARGLELLGHQPQDYQFLHPLDDINMSQSTNDVMPTALRLVAIHSTQALDQELTALIRSFEKLASKYRPVKKLGRTHLQDAVMISAGDQLGAYGQMLALTQETIKTLSQAMQHVNLGGTAVGTRESASVEFQEMVVDKLATLSGVHLTPAKDLMAATRSLADFGDLAAGLNRLGLDLIQISKDLRLLVSGPMGGFAEIVLTPIQNGSTIMPGKTNPVIPEAITQVGYLLMGNYLTISLCVQAGQLELNTMFPLLSAKLLESLEVATRAIKLFDQKCIATLEVNQERCLENLNRSTALATRVAKHIGYDQAAELAKKAIATNKSFVSVVKNSNHLTDDQIKQLTEHNE